jgi:DnaA family protein
MMQQLPLSISLRDDATFDNFLILRGNGLTLQALQQIDVDGAYSLAYLCGPGASGRSHLLQAVCHQHSQSVYLPLTELAAYRPSEVFATLERQALVCLDDVDAVAGIAPWEEALFHFINRKMLCGGALLVAAGQTAPGVFALPDLVSRLQQGLVLRLAAADDDDKTRVFIWRAGLRGMHLSEDVGAFVLRHYSRDLSQLMALLDQLDAQSLKQKRRITIPFVRQVIAAQSFDANKK